MIKALTQLKIEQSYGGKSSTLSILAYLFEFPIMFTAMSLALVLFLALDGKDQLNATNGLAEDVM